MNQVSRIAQLSLLFTLSMCSFEIFANKTLYFTPPEGYTYQEDLWELKKALSDLGYILKVADFTKPLDDFAGIIVQKKLSKKELDILAQYPLTNQCLILLEPPTVAPDYYDGDYHVHFGVIFLMLDDYVDNEKYIKICYPNECLRMGGIVPFQKKKLCTIIVSNKTSNIAGELYTERRNSIDFFEKNAPLEFDFYGRGWSKQEFSSYCGTIDDKNKILRNYKFNICYENSSEYNGYITEKIIDSFRAGCVPVYWGAPNITDYIPATCFIDRREFASHEDLYNFLKSMPESTYNTYLNNINTWLKSENAKCFTYGAIRKLIIATFVGNINKHNVTLS